MSPRLQLWGAYSAFALIACVFIGLIAGHLIPPPSPSWSNTHIQAFWVHHANGLRVCMIGMLLGGTFILPWGIALAFQLNNTTDAQPALTYIQVACAAVALVLFMCLAVVGSAAAFRPDTLSPDVTRMLNDTLWFWWLTPWEPFALWSVIAGVLILRDDNSVFPRWTGYLSIAIAGTWFVGTMPLFFHHGPFGYAGAVSWYVPTLDYFAWMLVMTICMIKAARRAEAAQREDVVMPSSRQARPATVTATASATQ
jgi:hypothetical protein